MIRQKVIDARKGQFKVGDRINDNYWPDESGKGKRTDIGTVVEATGKFIRVEFTKKDNPNISGKSSRLTYHFNSKDWDRLSRREEEAEDKGKSVDIKELKDFHKRGKLGMGHPGSQSNRT